MREFSLRRSSLPLSATLLSDRVPEGLEDVSKYANLFSSLYASGNWTLLDLKKLAGLNFLRVWREVEKVRDSQISTNIFFFGFQHDSKKLLESKPIFNWLCDNLKMKENIDRWARSWEGEPERSWYLGKSRCFLFPISYDLQAGQNFSSGNSSRKQKQKKFFKKAKDFFACCRGAVNVERWPRGRLCRIQTANQSRCSDGQSKLGKWVRETIKMLQGGAI